MTKILAEVLPGINRLEERYGSINNVPENNEELKHISKKLLAEESEDNDTKTWQNVINFFKQTNSSVYQARKRFNCSCETIEELFKLHFMEVPVIYIFKLTKDKLVFFAGSVADATELLQCSSYKMAIARKKRIKNNGWSIEKCKVSSINLLNKNRLDKQLPFVREYRSEHSRDKNKQIEQMIRTGYKSVEIARILGIQSDYVEFVKMISGGKK